MTASNPIPAARAWAEIDLGALVANARTVLSVSGSRLLPMVKANAYGTGAVPVARALESLDPWGFGVATVDEGAALRRAGITRPIVVFSPPRGDGLEECQRLDLRPAIGDLESLRWWLARGEGAFHLELDTGMARLGLHWRDTAALEEAGRLVADARGWEGVFTHFHSADVAPGSVPLQWDRFTQLLAGFPRRPALVHAANSAAALCGGRYAADLVRPGIFLYGGSAGPVHEPQAVVRLLAPVSATRHLLAGDTASYGATWRAERPTTIATLAIGYADGLPRHLGNGAGRVELRGAVRRIVGRVTMDSTMVDVGDDPVVPGDIATLFGGMLSLDAQAIAAGTISYELLTRLGERVERRYLEAS